MNDEKRDNYRDRHPKGPTHNDRNRKLYFANIPGY